LPASAPGQNWHSDHYDNEQKNRKVFVAVFTPRALRS